MVGLKKTNGTQFLYQINHYSYQPISNLIWKLILPTTTKAKISKIFKNFIFMNIKILEKKFYKNFVRYEIEIFIKYSTWW